MAVSVDQVKQILSKFVLEPATLEKATGESRIRGDLGVSSANLVDVVFALEDAFHVSITDDEIGKLRTIGDVVTCISAKS